MSCSRRTPHSTFWKQFYRKFPQFRQASVTAREFAPGERVEVDYAGDSIEWIELNTGEIHKAWVFVAALGFSQLLFAWAAEDMKSRNWLASHRRMFAFVNGIEMNPVQIDTSAAATDTIDYVATDSPGLTATSTRTVIVEAPANDNQATTTPANDNSPPITATGTNSGWSRVSVSNTAAALRAFLRYVAMLGVCDARLADTIRGPRIYRQESVPRGPGWSDVRRILTKTDTDEPRDIRNRAILMLLAIYGMRSGEVASLRLDQIDWRGHVLRLFRLKRRQAQVYPLLPSVAEALARYIDTVRPPVPHSEVFIQLQAPWRPIKPSSLYDIANREFVALGIQTAHPGPHALRHACATRLLADGLTLKEIGDHLGHRSTSATRTYAKVDIVSLREVGDFDLGDLQ